MASDSAVIESDQTAAVSSQLPPAFFFSASHFNTLQGLSPRILPVGFYMLLASCLVLLALGLYCAYMLEVHGHIISGMNNQVVWGLPHVFAVWLIVTASGALNGATLSTVFRRHEFKPFARSSVILAVALLLGGLMVLVLDLGRPDRLIVAMTHYNPKSIFSWNILLYSGFVVICLAYLWIMHEPGPGRRKRAIGWIALVWRVILTTGTGCIFGFLVGRNALDSAILGPMFIALSLVTGTAIYTLLLQLLHRWQQVQPQPLLIEQLARLQFYFLLALLYFSIVHHLTNLYVAEHAETESFLLLGHPGLIFWLGHVIAGGALPLFLLFKGFGQRSDIQQTATSHTPQNERSQAQGFRSLLWVSLLALAGGWSLLYHIIVGSQLLPQQIFPGKTVIASSFQDSGMVAYTASVWEWGLGMGGVALAFTLCLVAFCLLPLLPQRLPAATVSLARRTDRNVDANAATNVTNAENDSTADKVPSGI